MDGPSTIDPTIFLPGTPPDGTVFTRPDIDTESPSVPNADVFSSAPTDTNLAPGFAPGGDIGTETSNVPNADVFSPVPTNATLAPGFAPGGDTFTRGMDNLIREQNNGRPIQPQDGRPGQPPPLDPADPANAEVLAAQGELNALAAACAAGAGNGNPIFNMVKWIDIVGRCSNLIARIQSSITSAITDRVKAVGKDILARTTGIEGSAKGFVEYWKDEQKSIFAAIKLIFDLSKGST